MVKLSGLTKFKIKINEKAAIFLLLLSILILQGYQTILLHKLSAAAVCNQIDKFIRYADLGEIKIDNSDPHIGTNTEYYFLEFTDAQCPYCAAYAGNEELVNMMRQRIGSYTPAKENIIRDWVSTGKLTYFVIDFPLSFHQFALPAARVLNCIYEKKGSVVYFDALRTLFYTRSKWIGNFTEFVTILSNYIPRQEVMTCLNSTKYDSEISEDLNMARNFEIGGTPGFALLIPKDKAPDPDVLDNVLKQYLGRNYEVYRVTVNFDLPNKKGKEEYIAITFSGAYDYRTFNELFKALIK